MIGEQLRMLRIASKMTQKELAGELSVAFQTISNWENNSIDPSVNMILRIAEYFNCSTDYLLKGEGSGAKYIDTTSLTEKQHAQLLGIAREYSRLNKSQSED
ncbi:MAG: helix-turn-helix transcriptional regulator [Clostridiales bacterium]|nr:helix-turn-helix transcriptional regulator [Clostridiales bacterium]